MRELKRLENESKEQFIYRIYNTKINDGRTNKDCAEIINNSLGTSFQESYFRGIYSNYSKGYTDGFEEGLISEKGKTKLQEIQEELGELFVVKQEVRSKTNKLNKIKREFSKSIEIANDIKGYLKEDLNELDLFEFERIEISSDNKLIIQLADLHIGYVINDYKGNNYNYEILKKRMNKLISETKKYCSLYNITEIVIANCGDAVENTYMRETQQAYECEFNMSEQISKAIKFLYEFTSTISTFANVDFISVGGNHSRMSAKAQNIEGDNSNVIILDTLKMLFECNDRVNVIDIDYVDDSCEFNINGLKFLVVHGDNRVTDCKKLFDSENVDVILRGHYHNFNITSQDKGGYVITGGCAFGYNPYSVKRMACTTNASQTLIVVGDGEIELIKNIELQLN